MSEHDKTAGEITVINECECESCKAIHANAEVLIEIVATMSNRDKGDMLLLGVVFLATMAERMDALGMTVPFDQTLTAITNDVTSTAKRIRALSEKITSAEREGQTLQ